MCATAAFFYTSLCMCRISVDGKIFNLFKKDHKPTIYKCRKENEAKRTHVFSAYFSWAPFCILVWIVKIRWSRQVPVKLTLRRMVCLVFTHLNDPYSPHPLKCKLGISKCRVRSYIERSTSFASGYDALCTLTMRKAHVKSYISILG